MIGKGGSRISGKGVHMYNGVCVFVGGGGGGGGSLCLFYFLFFFP